MNNIIIHRTHEKYRGRWNGKYEYFMISMEKKVFEM